MTSILALSPLGKAILIEYAWVFGIVLFFFAITFIGAFLLEKDEKGSGFSGNFGLVIILIFVRIGVVLAAGVYAGIVKPILIFVRHHSEIGRVSPLIARIGVVALISLPFLLILAYAIGVFFGRKIENHFFRKKYETGKDTYEKAPEEYRKTIEFYEALQERDLYCTEADKELLEKLNQPYTIENLQSKYFYTRGTIFAVEAETFKDNLSGNRWMAATSTERAPVFVYNAILTLPEPDGQLRYAPLARYEDEAYSPRTRNETPFFKDYYIECKIVCVDGDMYAIVGVGEAWTVHEAFETVKPHFVILSETENIKTFCDGKYCPYGAVENESRGQFVMHPNTNEFDCGAPFRPINYPVRVVERLDRAAIDRYAAELQQGVLAESIEEYKVKKASEQ